MQHNSSIIQRMSYQNSVIINSSESGITELDRLDSSFNQSVMKFIKSDKKINLKFEISLDQIK